MDDDRNIAALEMIEAPPSIADIMTAIQDMRQAMQDDRQAMNERQDASNARIEVLETTMAELPAKFASAEDVRRIVSSQEEYELSRRTLTKQVADLSNVVADIQPKFTSIDTRLSDLTGTMNTMTGNLQTFMRTQDERLTHQQTTITEAKNKAETLAQEVATVKKEFSPVHDFIVGSDTQKPLMTVIDGIDSRLNTIAHQLTPAVDYITEQKKKEAERHSFWRTVRLNMYTPKGVFAAMLFIIVMLMIANSINFDQLGERIRQLADVIKQVVQVG